MKYIANGLLLFTEKYQQCVEFYRDKLKMEIIFDNVNPSLTNFRFGSGYLMIEEEGQGSPHPKGRHENPVVIRFDVEELGDAVRDLNENDIEVEVELFDWGHIGIFYDPDGNRCELYQTPEGGQANC